MLLPEGGSVATDWLPLFEYSAKYGVSVSTLRRRIRQKSLHFRLDQGKYLVADLPPDTEAIGTKRGLTFVETPKRREFSAPSLSKVSAKPVLNRAPVVQETSTTLALVEEIKRAYALILQEKEEQICLLKEEISDLRTLVRVLETENSRR